jgi:hypothetical protein
MGEMKRMPLGTKIVIDKRITYDGEFKKYRTTNDQIRQNEREKNIQRERDERARNQASIEADRATKERDTTI